MFSLLQEESADEVIIVEPPSSDFNKPKANESICWMLAGPGAVESLCSRYLNSDRKQDSVYFSTRVERVDLDLILFCH